MPEDREYNRQSDRTISIIAERVGELHTDVKEVRSGLTETLQEFSKVVQQLVRLEERSISTADAMDRFLKANEKINEKVDKVHSDCDVKIEKLATRISVLEKEQPKTSMVTDLFFKGIFALLGIVAMAVLAKAGLGI